MTTDQPLDESTPFADNAPHVRTSCEQVLKIDREAMAVLEVRRQLAAPAVPGWWRGLPNPFAVPYRVEDDDL